MQWNESQRAIHALAFPPEVLVRMINGRMRKYHETFDVAVARVAQALPMESVESLTKIYLVYGV
jgi:hypothetical protein